VSVAHMRLLIRLDLLRLGNLARFPAAGAVAGVALPLGLAVALFWSFGRAGVPAIVDSDGALLLALLVAGPISLLSYAALFRAVDEPFIRRLGLSARAVYVERSVRHFLQAMGVGALALVPFVAAGAPLRPVVTVIAAAGLAAWGAGVAAAAGAALAVARQQAGGGWGCLMAGIQDREVAAAAPLVYAPLPGFLAGALAGAIAGTNPWSLLVVAAAAGLCVWIGARWYDLALPRFAPRALELAFVPATTHGAGDFAPRRGLARLMPRRVASAWARDAAIVGRRFPWASRVAWPVAIGGFFGLARWGESPATREWVVGAVLLALLVQAIASLGLGRVERHGRRWIDRSLGLGAPARFVGRWAWGWGASLWITVPIALAWSWWSGAGPGWAWPAAGGVVAGVAATSSILAAGWR
jgi:hypothetical protein